MERLRDAKLRCPRCRERSHLVIVGYPGSDSSTTIRRRRKCLRCNATLTTTEYVAVRAEQSAHVRHASLSGRPGGAQPEKLLSVSACRECVGLRDQIARIALALGVPTPSPEPRDG